MKWRIGSCLVIGILASSAAAAEPEPKIVVFVYDYVAVSPTVLAGAERESTRIYQQAGISLSWVNCSLSDHESRKFSACEQVKEPANLFVNLLDPAKATEFRRQGKELPTTSVYRSPWCWAVPCPTNSGTCCLEKTATGKES